MLHLIHDLQGELLGALSKATKRQLEELFDGVPEVLKLARDLRFVMRQECISDEDVRQAFGEK